MNKIRVAMILHAYYPTVGGAELQLKSLLPHLRERGVEPIVLTRRAAGLKSFELVDDVPVYRLPAFGPKPLAAAVFVAAALLRLRQFRPQVIHAYDLMSPTSAALRAKQLWGMPVVAKVLSGGPQGDIDRLRRRPNGAARLRGLAQQVDRFIVISQEIAAELDAIGARREQYAFIPNGVDLQRFAPASAQQKSEARRLLGLPPHGLIVLSVGRVIHEKRPANLLAVWPALAQRFPDASLVWVGAGDMLDAMRVQTTPRAFFVGQSDRVDLYLQAADVFVLPSAREGLSNALLEALASGLPCAVTAIGAAPELIRTGESGLLIAPDDLPALEQALTHLMADEHLRANLGQAGRQSVLRTYSLPGTAHKLVDLYRQLASRPNS